MKAVSCLLFPLLLASCGTTPPVPAAPVAAPPELNASALFEFRSGFWINLHHTLRAVARNPDRALLDEAALAGLPAAHRQGWEAAVATYRREAAERPLFDGSMIELKNRLAVWDPQHIGDAGLDLTWAAALSQAAPAYRALLWPAHDAANRAWITDMTPLLERYGSAIAGRITDAYAASWPDRPIPVDVSTVVEFPGAYTTVRPSHIVMASGATEYTGTLGLEMLFHEALHTLDDSISAAYRAARAGRPSPHAADVLHALIFYTAGELTRRVVPEHTPFIVARGVRERGSLARHFAAIEEHWGAFLDGRIGREEAVARIAAGD